MSQFKTKIYHEITICTIKDALAPLNLYGEFQLVAQEHQQVKIEGKAYRSQKNDNLAFINQVFLPYIPFKMMSPTGYINSWCIYYVELTCPVCYRMNTKPAMCPWVEIEAVEKTECKKQGDDRSLLFRIRIDQTNTYNA